MLQILHLSTVVSINDTIEASSNSKLKWLHPTLTLNNNEGREGSQAGSTVSISDVDQ